MIKLLKFKFLMVAFMLGSCGPLIDLPGSGDAPMNFELEAPTSFPKFINQKNWSLFVEDVSASGAIRSDSIMVKSGANKVEYYAGALWADRTPRLIGRHILESFENAGQFKVFGNDAIDLSSDYRLRVDVREFAALPQENKVRIRVSAMFLRSVPSEIISQRQFTSEASYRGDDVQSVVRAFNEAMDEMSTNMVTWLSGME